jgi:hypothetical protein
LRLPLQYWLMLVLMLALRILYAKFLYHLELV